MNPMNQGKLAEEVVDELREMVKGLYGHSSQHWEEVHPLSEIGVEYGEQRNEFMGRVGHLQEMIEKHKAMLEKSSQEDVLKYTALVEGEAVDFAYLRKYDNIFGKLSVLGQRPAVFQKPQTHQSEISEVVDVFYNEIVEQKRSREMYSAILFELERICSELTTSVATLNYEVEYSGENDSRASIQIGSNGNSQEHCFAILLELDSSRSDPIESLSVIFAYDSEWSNPTIDEDVRKCISEGTFDVLKHKLKWILKVEKHSEVLPPSSDYKLKEMVLKEFGDLGYQSFHLLEGPGCQVFESVQSIVSPEIPSENCRVSFLGLFGSQDLPEYVFNVSPPLRIRVKDIPKEILSGYQEGKVVSEGSFSNILGGVGSRQIQMDGIGYLFAQSETDEMGLRGICLSHFKIDSLTKLGPILLQFQHQYLGNHLYHSCFSPLLESDSSLSPSHTIQVSLSPPTGFHIECTSPQSSFSFDVSLSSEGATVDNLVLPHITSEFATLALRLTMSIPALVSNLLY